MRDKIKRKHTCQIVTLTWRTFFLILAFCSSHVRNFKEEYPVKKWSDKESFSDYFIAFFFFVFFVLVFGNFVKSANSLYIGHVVSLLRRWSFVVTICCVQKILLIHSNRGRLQTEMCPNCNGPTFLRCWHLIIDDDSVIDEFVSCSCNQQTAKVIWKISFSCCPIVQYS